MKSLKPIINQPYFGTNTFITGGNLDINTTKEGTHNIPHNLNIKNRVLNPANYTYKPITPMDLVLKDKMICYYDGTIYKIIPLKTMLSYPIIHDKYNEDGKLIDISIIVCPFTLASMVLDDLCYPTEYVYSSCLVIKKKSLEFPIINAHDYIKHRHQISIKILRNVFTEYPNCNYLVLNDELPKSLLPLSYYENSSILYSHLDPPTQFHPKTLVYIIQYKSSRDDSIKNTVIVGKDANDKEISGYNIFKSGLNAYLKEHENSIIKKMGFTIPVLWFAWKSFYPNARIVFLT